MTSSDASLAYCMAFDEELFALKPFFERSNGEMIPCRNAIVYALCMRLEVDRSIFSFGHKTPHYRFYNPVSNNVGKESFHLVANGEKGQQLYLCTAQKYLHTPMEEARIEAAESAALDLGASFHLITDMDLFGPDPEYMKSVLRFWISHQWETMEEYKVCQSYTL